MPGKRKRDGWNGRRWSGREPQVLFEAICWGFINRIMASTDDITCEQCLSKLKGDKYEWREPFPEQSGLRRRPRSWPVTYQRCLRGLLSLPGSTSFWMLQPWQYAQIAVKFSMKAWLHNAKKMFCQNPIKKTFFQKMARRTPVRDGCVWQSPRHWDGKRQRVTF